MDKLNFTSKNNGDVLNASEWNAVVSKTDELVDAINGSAGSDSGSGSVVVEGDSHVTFDGTNKHNLTIATTAADQYTKNGETKGGKINIEPISDLQIKSGDDIILCSHHREDPTEVSVKIHDGEDHPVKLQVNTADIVLTTKDKNLTKQKDEQGEDTNVALYDDPAVLNVTVNSAKNTRGYLKVRAQAIDLRSETHGGIALQPKGADSQGNMNKIKFEHGGGDGLEFGTFNTEKTSIFTDEYRFNKNGVWKMATRQVTASDKADENDATTAYKYVKQSDDFYDIVSSDDETATTNAIIKTAHAMNDGKNRHAKYEEKVTSSGNLKKTLEIETVITIQYTPTTNSATSAIVLPESVSNVDKVYTISDFKDAVKLTTIEGTAQKYGVRGEDGITLSAGDIVTINGANYEIVENFSPSIDITSGADLSVKAKDGVLSLGGNNVEFGSDIIDLGEMEDGLYAQYKLTKKNNSKACDVLKVKVINNQTTPLSFDSDSANFAVDSFYPGSDANHPAAVSVPGKVETPTTDQEATQHIQVVAQCKIIDIIKFVAWAKNNNFGPWAA